MRVLTTSLGNSVEVTLPERCETCERWKRASKTRMGQCGKRGWRTDEGDWCRFHLKEISNG